MKITQLDVKVIGIKHTAPFETYSLIIPGKVQQTMQRMQELGMDKSERYIIYEPKKGEHHEEGIFLTGVAMENGDEQVPTDMEIVHSSGDYAVLETIFDPMQMGEFYTQLDQWIYQSEYKHSQDRFIIELYKERTDGSQELIIFMPVAGIGIKNQALGVEIS